ncbi:methyltransferase domain-containing protein [Henriciella sp.]|uniref:class I SAM-dependent methyltransferase n=1 Tax=Henriciella sp. TaxID=1968823 RepID=UPI0026340D0A|nr:methyltransferase domain-containing protein [Henriciella sp.]
MRRHIMVAAAPLLMLAACSSMQESDLPEATVPAPPMMGTANVSDAQINEAIVNPERPETDVERDELRKPAAVLSYMELMPGDTLLEMEAGDGYFTEIFSHYLGPQGELYMQNPAAFDSFLGDAPAKRLERLENVEYVRSNFDDIPLDDASVDVVTWFQGPHELWYTPESGAMLVGNPQASFPEIKRVLKPGGSFIVIDHAAPSGAPASTGGDTHRIDPQIVRDLAREAGFVLISENDLYDNPDDDLDASVFDEAVRGKTDQFMMKFEKPINQPPERRAAALPPTPE